MTDNLLPEPDRNCTLCPRLADYRDQNKKQYPDWYNGAVSSFGDLNAEVLIVGLAPGVSGANRTGRPFTGDYAGDLLYATLEKYGFSRGIYAKHRDDGLTLNKIMITNAVRCVPPQNKPIGSEINTCAVFLRNRINALQNLKILITLGKIAHDATIRALDHKLSAYKFGHANMHDIGGLKIIDSYHCSRINTNTGRLTEEMFEQVFAIAKAALG